ncbi:MAG: hypothetical protein J07HB67_00402 [halophilic archaeon J07HB67]|jgi:hypothetical protein|nr:MAG: hypothetical protein J07HB67_00402 [halophilic archaeon J07HB67]
MPRDTTRRRLLGTLGVGVTAGLAGCGSAGETETDTATETEAATPTPTDTTAQTDAVGAVRVAHLSPNAPSVTVFLDGIPTFEDVAYGTVTDYGGVMAGEHTVRITPADDTEQTVFEGSISVAGNTGYTVAATGELGEAATEPFTPQVLTDEVTDPGDDTARLRLFHASPDAPAVDVQLVAGDDTVALFDGVSFGQAPTATVPAGQYTVEVRGDTADGSGDVVAAYDLQLTADGGTYSVFATGYLSPESVPDDVTGEREFDLQVTRDDGGTRQIDAAPSQAAFRVAHLSPNAPSVEVFTDQMIGVSDLAFGDVSEYRPVTPGGRPVEIRLADDPETAVFGGRIPFESGVDYTVAAVGEVGDGDFPFEPVVLRDDTSSLDEDTARVRLVHAVPDAPAVDVVTDDGSVVFDGVAYGSGVYTELPAGEYSLSVYGDTNANEGEPITTVDVTAEGGGVYTLFAAGYLTADGEPADTELRVVSVRDD